MIAKSILFSGPMVRAIREGRKTQTRRAPHSQPPHDCGPIAVGLYHPTVLRRGEEEPGPETWGAYSECGNWSCRLPYAPGDRLWVREAWRAHAEWDAFPPRDIPPGSPVQYVADEPLSPWDSRYRHAQLMPRCFSRTTIIVTEVRVQHLQDISEADAVAEGALKVRNVYPFLDVERGLTGAFPTARQWFECVWTQLNGPGAWADNPGVAAYTFEVEEMQ